MGTLFAFFRGYARSGGRFRLARQCLADRPGPENSSVNGEEHSMVQRRGNGFHPVAQLQNEMDQLVSSFFGSGQASRMPLARTFPPLNVWEDAENLFAESEIPGLKSEDLDITVVGSDLTIRGSRGGEAREGAIYHRRERGYGEFNRVLRLPIEVDADKVEATLKDGVLLIKLPKAESAKPKKIKVHATDSPSSSTQTG